MKSRICDFCELKPASVTVTRKNHFGLCSLNERDICSDCFQKLFGKKDGSQAPPPRDH